LIVAVILNLNLTAMLLGMKMLNPQIRRKMASNKMDNIKMASEIHQHLEDAMIADQIATTAADALAEDDAAEVGAAAVETAAGTAAQIVAEAIEVGAMTIVATRDRRVDRRVVVAHRKGLLLIAKDNHSRLISARTRRLLRLPQHLPQHLRRLRLQRRLQRRRQNRSVDHFMAPQCV
jgi:hypothetical protein